MIKVKICGLTSLNDYNAAVRLGADFTGFIFFKQSARFISPKEAKRVIEQGRQGANLKVGVFVNDSIERIRQVYEEAGLDIVQLHGEESPDYCIRLGLPFWKVIRIKNENSLDLIGIYPCSTFLLDTFSDDFYGGTGTAFDLSIGADTGRAGKKIIIAGGISVENIESVIRIKPFAVDINSSIEDKPGKKNTANMKRFFEKLKHLQARSNEI